MHQLVTWEYCEAKGSTQIVPLSRWFNSTSSRPPPPPPPQKKKTSLKQKNGENYYFPHNHGSETWLCLKGNYYWRDPFLTSMIMGGSVAFNLNIPSESTPPKNQPTTWDSSYSPKHITFRSPSNHRGAITSSRRDQWSDKRRCMGKFVRTLLAKVIGTYEENTKWRSWFSWWKWWLSSILNNWICSFCWWGFEIFYCLKLLDMWYIYNVCIHVHKGQDTRV